jgi:predicted RND superfamily exporter protein
MKTLARLIVNRTTAWGVVIVVLALAGLSLLSAREVEHEDDILAFLPQDNPEVQVFSDINKRFGGLDVALVGIQARDVLTSDFLARLRQVTRELKETKGLDHVLSLANTVDFTPDPEKGGVVTALLVDELPRTGAEREALRSKVLSRDHVVGNLVARHGEAVLIYCYLAYGTDPKAMAARIKETVRARFPREQVFWGGGPFISTYIYNTTERDMQRLTPWAVLAIVLIMVVSFRDVIGSCLALLSTAIGIVLSLGLMGLLGVRFNLVLSSMPVILFAIGSAYGIHVLARYYRLMQAQAEGEAPPRAGGIPGAPERPQGARTGIGEAPPCAGAKATKDTASAVAIAKTLSSVGPTVLAAGLTTAAGLLSFIMMDIRPMRTFGVFTALGILFTLALSLTFIPAVVRLVGLKRRPTRSLVARTLMVRFAAFAAGHRLLLGLPLLAVAGLGAFHAARVDSRMDHSTFFSAGSPPDRAERFLRRHFGGSQFIQVLVRGEMTDPGVLRELQRLADGISLMPHVSSVLHVGQAVGLVNEVMVGQRRIPDTRAQVKLLYAFLAGDPSVSQLVTSDRKHALMHIKVSSNLAADLEPLVARLEQLTGQEAPLRLKLVPAAQAQDRQVARLGARIEALARQVSQPLAPQQARRVEAELRAERPVASEDKVAAGLARFLRSEECAVKLPEPEKAGEGGAGGAGARADGGEGGKQRAEEPPSTPIETVAQALARLGPSPDEPAIQRALAGALARPEEDELVQDLALSVAAPLEEIWRLERARLHAARLVKAASVDAGNKKLLAGVATTLMDLDLPQALVAGPGGVELGYQVNGLPVMHRGLSRSVESNQLRSLGFALGLIVLIMALIFRSLLTGLLVATPTLLTLLVVYGGMGLIGVRLDIGTSMLASLILGAGVDYAVHLASAWYAPDDAPLVAAAANAADRTGPAIWTNAIMVCAGFVVLATGEARPLQNVGGLTGAAMITAAVVTFIVIPVLARRRRYSRTAASLELGDDSEAVKAALNDAPEG